METPRERIRRVLADGAIKKSALAREAGFGLDVLTGVEDDSWNPRSATVEALVEALDRIAQRLAAVGPVK
jgi:predicted transcriptional regulator